MSTIYFLVRQFEGQNSPMRAESTVELHDALVGPAQIVGMMTAIPPGRERFGGLCSPFHERDSIGGETLTGHEATYPAMKVRDV